jgi:hypothetical protein
VGVPQGYILGSLITQLWFAVITHDYINNFYVVQYMQQNFNEIHGLQSHIKSTRRFVTKLKASSPGTAKCEVSEVNWGSYKTAQRLYRGEILVTATYASAAIKLTETT